MTLLTWGPLHRENWESTKENTGDEVWLKRVRFEALLRGRAPPENTRAGEEMHMLRTRATRLLHGWCTFQGHRRRGISSR